jgi:hypothetical protein
MAELQRSVLQPQAMEYALAKFELELENELNAASGSLESQRKRMYELNIELARLAEAIATQGAAAALLRAISVRESERSSIERILLGSGPGSIKTAIANARELAMERLQQVREVIQSQTQAARVELSKHLDRIIIRPTFEGDVAHYVAEGGPIVRCQECHAAISAIPDGHGGPSQSSSMRSHLQLCGDFLLAQQRVPTKR